MGREAQNALDRSKRSIRELISAKDFERLGQMSSLDRFVQEGQRIGNELKTKGTSSTAARVGNMALNIEPYARIVESLCKLAPFGGNILWGVISLLLIISGTNANILEEILSFFTGVAEQIEHLKLVEDTFIESEIVVTAVEAVYIAVLEFWVKAVVYYTERMKAGVRSRIKMWFISSTPMFREFIKLRDKISTQRTRLHEIEVSQNHAIEKAERVRHQQKEISDFISAPEYNIHLHTAKKYRHDGTCEWLKHKEEYRNWTGCLTSGLLVIYGTAGAGKTILSSWLIDQARSRPAEHITLYHFFKRTDDKYNTALSATRSLLHQVYLFLLSTNDLLVETLESHVRDLLLHPSIHFESLWDILSLLFSEYSKRFEQEATPAITLILDAMDECEDSKDLVQKLVHATSNKIHIAVTGRLSGDHVDAFLLDGPNGASPRVLHIGPNDVQDDIAAFIKHSINNIERLGDSRHHSLRDRTIIILSNVENHQGMFLWADLMCKEVQKQQRVTGIDTLLKRLPKGLYGMYQRICERLSASDEIDFEFSRCVLEWVVASRRPMTFAELEAALRFMMTGVVNLEDKFFDEDGGLIWSRRDIVRCCGDLVRYSGLDEGDTIEIIHLSAQQFLSTRIQNSSSDALTTWRPFFVDVPSMELKISLTCIKYILSTSSHSHEYLSSPLGFPSGRTTNQNIFKEQYSLFDYATIYWAEYAMDVTQSNFGGDFDQTQQLYATMIEFTRSPVSAIWLEELIRLTYIEYAQHVIRCLTRLDSISSPDILHWLDIVSKVLTAYSIPLSSHPHLARLCISQPEIRTFDLSTTTLAADQFRDWVHYDPDRDNIISISKDSRISRILLKCQSLKTGIRSRPNLVSYDGLQDEENFQFQSAAVSPSANYVAVGYRDRSYNAYSLQFGAILIICWSIKNSSATPNIGDWATLVLREFTPTNERILHTNPIVQWVQDDTLLTPRGIFDLRIKRYVNMPHAIYEPNSECTFSYSGDGRRVARIKHGILEVLDTGGTSIYQVEFLAAPDLMLQAISHSGGKVVVTSSRRSLLCCIVVDQAKFIDMPSVPITFSGTGTFTRDESRFVAKVPVGRLAVWTFRQDSDKSYHNYADMAYASISRDPDLLFDLVPGAALIVSANGKITRQPLDSEQTSGPARSKTVMKWNGSIQELKICSIGNSLITIELWSLKLPHPKLITRTGSPIPGYHSLRGYSLHGTYLATDKLIIDTRTSSNDFGVCELNLPVGTFMRHCEFNIDETLFAYCYSDISSSRLTVCVVDVSQGPEITERASFTFESDRWWKVVFSKHNPALLAIDKCLLRLDNHLLAVEAQIGKEIEGFSDCGSYYYDTHEKLYELPARLISEVQPPMDIKYLPSFGSYVYPPHHFMLMESSGILFLIWRLDNVRRSRVVYVAPDGMLEDSWGCYLIWPEEEVENMKVLLVLDEVPIIIDTRIRRFDLMNEGEWVLFDSD